MSGEKGVHFGGKAGKGDESAPYYYDLYIKNRHSITFDIISLFINMLIGDAFVING